MNMLNCLYGCAIFLLWKAKENIGQYSIASNGSLYVPPEMACSSEHGNAGFCKHLPPLVVKTKECFAFQVLLPDTYD